MTALWQCLFHFLHEQKEAAEPHFMPFGMKQLADFGQRHLQPRGFHNHSGLRNSQAEKLVALAIFALTCFEEAGKHLPLFLILHAEHGFYDVVCCNHRGIVFKQW